MSAQPRIPVGVGVDPWHQRQGNRVRFTAVMNGARHQMVGTVQWVSSTAALIKLREEFENDAGRRKTRLVEVPTAVIDEATVRTLRKGEM